MQRCHHALPVTGRIRSTMYPLPFSAVTRELSMTQRLGDQQIAEIRRAYYALITEIDYHLGRLFGHLTQEQLLEDTWILFTSDHGEMLGRSPHGWQMRTA